MRVYIKALLKLFKSHASVPVFLYKFASLKREKIIPADLSLSAEEAQQQESKSSTRKVPLRLIKHQASQLRSV